jgi:hypothetical protein
VVAAHGEILVQRQWIDMGAMVPPRFDIPASQDAHLHQLGPLFDAGSTASAGLVPLRQLPTPGLDRTTHVLTPDNVLANDSVAEARLHHANRPRLHHPNRQ